MGESNEKIIAAKRLRQALEKAKMSQQELAEKSGVPKASISHYAHGRYIPRNDKAGAMAKVLKVNPAWLIGFDVPMLRPEDMIDLTTLSEEHGKELLAYYRYLLQKEGAEDG